MTRLKLRETWSRVHPPRLLGFLMKAGGRTECGGCRNDAFSPTPKNPHRTSYLCTSRGFLPDLPDTARRLSQTGRLLDALRLHRLRTSQPNFGSEFTCPPFLPVREAQFDEKEMWSCGAEFFSKEANGTPTSIP